MISENFSLKDFFFFKFNTYIKQLDKNNYYKELEKLIWKKKNHVPRLRFVFVCYIKKKVCSCKTTINLVTC